MDFINVQATPVSIIVYSSIGLAGLTFIFGFCGILLTFCRFLRLGSKRFFRQVDRPTLPSKANDPIYGTHEMIKLNVFVFYCSPFYIRDCFFVVLVIRCITSLCISRFTKSTNDIISSWFS